MNFSKNSSTFNFKKNKKVFISAIATICALSLAACENIDISQLRIQRQTEVEGQTSTETIATSISGEGPTNTSISPGSSSVTDPTGPTEFKDNFGQLLPVGNKIITLDDYNNFCSYTVYYGFTDIGMDNPYLLSYIQDYFNDSTLTLDDINFLQFYGSNFTQKNGFDDFINTLTNGQAFAIDFDLLRYILEENNLRMWVDEIPYSYFETNFPDIMKGIEEYGCFEVQDKNYDPSHWDLLKGYGFDGYSYASITIDGTEEQRKELEYDIFNTASLYNMYRNYYLYYYEDTSLREIARTTDGKIIWVPTEIEYNQIMRKTNQIPGCENIDIMYPESREDLINSGIDLDRYDEFYTFVIGQNTLVDTASAKSDDGGSRSRSN